MKKIYPLLVLLFLIGCASSPQLINMVPHDQALVYESSGKTLKVANTVAMQKDNLQRVNTKDFNQVLIESLKNSKLFAEIIIDKTSDYELVATILSQEQPAMGLDMTVYITVAYVIKNSATGQKIFEKTIPTSYTATVGDAFVGTTRLRKATEGAVRENIKYLLTEISKIQL